MNRVKPLSGMAVLGIVIALLLALLAWLEVVAGTTAPVSEIEKPWAPHLAAVDRALAERNVTAAMAAWHEAYSAARGARRGDGMVAVGDAYLRIGDAASFRRSAEPTARRLYLAALFRARQDRSLEGVLRATEAFAALGDHDVARRGLVIAEDIARGRAEGDVERVREIAARLVRADEPMF
jgi:hypothetical protein